jgi:hypothetical protein
MSKREEHPRTVTTARTRNQDAIEKACPGLVSGGNRFSDSALFYRDRAVFQFNRIGCRSKERKMRTQYLRLAVAGLFAAAPLAAQAEASPYDGRWMIVAVADGDNCDESYRLPIDVQDGAIRYAGPFAVDASGRVNAAGRLNMTLTHDGDVVRARGSLGARTGNGEWVSPGCAGDWKGHKS